MRYLADRVLKVWSRLKPFVSLLMFAVIMFFIARYAMLNWDKLVSNDWQVHWPWLLVSVIAMLVFYTGLAFAWQRLISWNDTGTFVSLLSGLWVWSRSSLARYLPTPIWMTASRVYLTRQLGVSWRYAGLGFVAELVGSLGGAFSVALLSLPVFTEVSILFCVVVVLFVAVLVLPFLYFSLIRFLGYYGLCSRCCFGSLVLWSVQYTFAFIVYGIAHIMILENLGIRVAPYIVIGVSSLAWGVGVLNVLSPGGLGTREVVLIYGLQDYIDPPELLALSIIARLVATFGELLLFVGIYVLSSNFMNFLSMKKNKTGDM